MTFAGRDVAFAWQSSVEFFRNQYFDEDDFHLMVVSARTGPAWLAARKWRFQIPVQGDYISLGDQTIAWYGGVIPSLTYFAGRMSLTTLLQVQGRDFRRRIDEARDSLYVGGGFSLGYRSLEGRVGAGVGIQLFDEDADTERRSNNGQQVTGFFNFRPWPSINTFLQASYRTRDYHDVEPFFDVARDELEKRFVAGANYTFTDAGLLNNMVAELFIRHTNNDSNVRIFDFNRNQVLFRVYRSF